MGGVLLFLSLLRRFLVVVVLSHPVGVSFRPFSSFGVFFLRLFSPFFSMFPPCCPCSQSGYRRGILRFRALGFGGMQGVGLFRVAGVIGSWRPNTGGTGMAFWIEC